MLEALLRLRATLRFQLLWHAASSSILSGSRMPDVLRCGYHFDTVRKEFFYSLHSQSNSGIQYNWNYGPMDSYIQFNHSDGSYLQANEDQSTLCEHNISDLYTLGRAFEIVTSKTYGVSDTMIPNFPDIIKCGNSDTELFYKLYRQDDAGIRYGVNYGLGLDASYIEFNMDGSYQDGNNIQSTSCNGKTIEQLYDLERAFNVVTSRAHNGSETMVPDFPDMLKCGNSETAWIFALQGQHDSFIRYDMTYGTDVPAELIMFNLDGSYKETNSEYSTGCQETSISDLYALGRAFNIVSTPLAVSISDVGADLDGTNAGGEPDADVDANGTAADVNGTDADAEDRPNDPAAGGSGTSDSSGAVVWWVLPVLVGTLTVLSGVRQ